MRPKMVAAEGVAPDPEEAAAAFLIILGLPSMLLWGERLEFPEDPLLLLSLPIE